VHIDYNIACQYNKNFWRRWANLPDFLQATFSPQETSFVVGALHITGRVEECQAEYAGDYLEGNGITSGDNIEHGWAFMNRFLYLASRMTISGQADFLDKLADGFNFEKQTCIGKY
jgi:hypothetical protein